MSGKGRQYRLHIQFAFASHNLLLQLGLLVEPCHRQRSVPSVDVCHAVPRQIGRACEVGANLAVRHTQLLPYVVPHGFLSGYGERHVYTVECHPVNHALPFLPVEEGHSVSVGAIVEEEAAVDACLYRNFLFYLRQLCWHNYRVLGIPRHCGVAVVVEIMVQAHSHSVGIVAAHHNFVAVLLQAEYILLVLLLHQLELEAVGMVGHNALGQCTHSVEAIVSCKCLYCEDKQEQKCSCYFFHLCFFL